MAMILKPDLNQFSKFQEIAKSIALSQSKDFKEFLNSPDTESDFNLITSNYKLILPKIV